MINIKKGLDLPIDGKPQQTISSGPEINHVALLSSDYPGLRPSMSVEVGDLVKKGQLLFVDKKNPGSRYTSPAAGKIVAVNRGERRAFQSIVIEVDPNGQSEVFAKTAKEDLNKLSAKDVLDELLAAGMWSAFRARPFDKVPAVGTLPHSVFVTAIDTNPLCADPAVIINEEADAFVDGLTVLSRLGVKVHVCKGEASLPKCAESNVSEDVFVGPHPAGLPGTHIHFIDPVNENKTVWYIGYQDVIAIGHLFTEGEYYNKRVVAIAGPQVIEPKLVSTVQGANITELTAGRLKSSANGVRVIAGSALWGHAAVGPFAYLGRFNQQVTVLEEGRMHDFLFKGWMGPGFRRHSATRAFASAFIKPAHYIFNTALNGGARPMVPVGSYERVLPLDMEPTLLLRAIEINDTDQAKLLGILELGEEDLALCTYVDPGKTDYGPLLRRSLTKIELEG